MRKIFSIFLLACALMGGSLAMAQGTDPVTPNGPGVVQLGSTGQWWKNFFFGANTTSYGTITGTFTAPRTFTFPDSSGTVAFTGGAPTFTTVTATATGSFVAGTSGTSVGQVILNNATSGTITLAPTTGALGTVTATFPATSITVPGTVYTSCANSLSCATPANTSATAKVAYGTGALSSASPSLAHVTAIAPAFADTSHMFCTVSPIGTTAAIAAGGLAVNLVSGSAFDVTGPNTVTTAFNWMCVGT